MSRKNVISFVHDELHKVTFYGANIVFINKVNSSRQERHIINGATFCWCHFRSKRLIDSDTQNMEDEVIVEFYVTFVLESLELNQMKKLKESIKCILLGRE